MILNTDPTIESMLLSRVHEQNNKIMSNVSRKKIIIFSLLFLLIQLIDFVLSIIQVMRSKSEISFSAIVKNLLFIFSCKNLN